MRLGGGRGCGANDAARSEATSWTLIAFVLTNIILVHIILTRPRFACRTDPNAATTPSNPPRTQSQDEREFADLQHKQETLMKSKLSETLPAIITAAMAYNRRDITRTLKNVCKKLFNDCDVVKPDRILRARTLLILGHIFLDSGRAAVKVGDGDVVKRAEVAVMSTMAKGQGQEVDINQMEELIKEGGVEWGCGEGRGRGGEGVRLGGEGGVWGLS